MGVIATATALTGLLPVIKSVLGRVLPDKDQVNALAHEIEQGYLAAMQQQDAGQVEINKIDQASGNLWQAGWRPMVGWTAAILFAIAHGGPIVCALMGDAETAKLIYSFENTADGILYGMLGMATMRGAEKAYKGII